MDYLNTNEYLNKDGSLKCAVKRNPAGHSYNDVCGRGCIKFTFKPWSVCEHTVKNKQ